MANRHPGFPGIDQVLMNGSMSNGSIVNGSMTTSNNGIHMTFSQKQQVTVLKETVLSTHGKLVSEFDQVDEEYIHCMTIEAFLEYIERQRLIHMPHRGSRWDKILKWAEFFGLQISRYAHAVEGFVPESQVAAKLIWAACHVLLDVSPTDEILESRLMLHSWVPQMPMPLKQRSGFSTILVSPFPCFSGTLSSSMPILTFAWKLGRLSTLCSSWSGKSVSTTRHWRTASYPTKPALISLLFLASTLINFVSIGRASRTPCGLSPSVMALHQMLGLSASGSVLGTKCWTSFTKEAFSSQGTATNTPANGSIDISWISLAVKMMSLESLLQLVPGRRIYLAGLSRDCRDRWARRVTTLYFSL